MAGHKPTSAQVCLHRDGYFYVHIQLKFEAPEPNRTTNVIGVDFGRREIAKTSTDKGWDGKQITKIRDKYARVRASLQRKASQGTRSTRRRARQALKRLSGRERRFQQWLNHNISKSIIAEAKKSSSTVAIEDLTGIRRSTNEQPRNKTERRRSNSWAFHQLRIFLEYKGVKEGVKVIAVPPAYTSQTCNCCLHIGVRTNKKFKCVNHSCGWIGDADTNGSLVIALLGAAFVNSPKGSWLSCSLDEAAGGLLKAPCSA
nr:transposase [Chroococcidiopsis sp. CCMEE 29]